MANAYSMDDIVDFLNHASERGLMPAATATALAVSVRNVFGVLNETERADLSKLELESVIKRFNNKRARDFSPTSLKEYGRRVHRASDLYLQWINDPANFSVKTRTTKVAGKKSRGGGTIMEPSDATQSTETEEPTRNQERGYASSFPIRTEWIVSLVNIPPDLTKAEAQRLGKFIEMLAVV